MCEDTLIRFQSTADIYLDSFLRILEFYQRSTLIEYEGVSFIQKKVVCIGSSIAPILSEIYSNDLLRSILTGLEVRCQMRVLLYAGTLMTF